MQSRITNVLLGLIALLLLANLFRPLTKVTAADYKPYKVLRIHMQTREDAQRLEDELNKGWL